MQIGVDMASAPSEIPIKVTVDHDAISRVPAISGKAHYVSHGSPVRTDGTQAYTSQCRAAIITEIGGWVTVEITEPDSFSRSEGRPIRHAEQWYFDDALGLMVANPTGQIFTTAVRYDHGEAPDDGDTALCDGLDHKGGTWHWPHA